MQTIGKPHSTHLSLYFHIPFCTRKCDYCHFYVLLENEQSKEKLLEGFYLEWDRILPLIRDKHIVSIYFGGGTPSLFGAHRIQEVLCLIYKSIAVSSTVEVTLEANPENITLKTMQAYRKAGINRVSIGVQTLDANLLKLLGRLHTPQTALQAIQMVYQAGIHNISIDLMYDLPKQTLHHWINTLAQLVALPITHLSLYNLTIEPHTIFFKNQAQIRAWLPDDETSTQMYEMAIERLEEMGLYHYEISAFAKPGYHSQHNVGYWLGRSFWGLGPSAFSYWEGKRFRNISHLEKYYKKLKNSLSPIDFEEVLDLQAHRREFLVIQLRLLQGLSLDEFIQEYGPLEVITLETLHRLTKEGYFQQTHQHIQITKKGILFYDTIAAELI
jgi:oxygen-independent coproporphyrinogen-3 oxidase